MGERKIGRGGNLFICYTWPLKANWKFEKFPLKKKKRDQRLVLMADNLDRSHLVADKCMFIISCAFNFHSLEHMFT